MAISDIFKAGQLRRELELQASELATLRATMSEIGALDAVNVKAAIADLEAKRLALDAELGKHEQELGKRRVALAEELGVLERQIVDRRKELVTLDEELLLQGFGVYHQKFGLQSSDAYKTRIDQIQKAYAAMVKSGTAATGAIAWTLNNDPKEGARMVKDYTKLILRAFNSECDAAVSSVKFNNAEALAKRLTSSFDKLNTLGERMKIAISKPYRDLRLAELYAVHEFQVKRQEEKEEQRLLREQLREEAKAQKELEEAKAKFGKEEKHFQTALTKLDAQLTKANTDAERELIAAERAVVVEKLAEVAAAKADVQFREQNTRAGYVYVISNIGAFGEGIYKIGVTRRLDPQERIDELGDASVPFGFDIHAMIFSDDAPALELALHREFARRRLNQVNLRREFFRVTLDEIKTVVRSNFSKPVEFVDIAEATQYRESIELVKEQAALKSA